jgi:riboflavin kinase
MMIFMKEQLWFTLLTLAQLGAVTNNIRTSTSRLAKLLQISQQTASRRLQELENRGLIHRVLNNRGQLIKIQQKGISELGKIQSILEMALTKKRYRNFRGRILTGLGEGAYYIQLDGYRKQFRKMLGYTPFPGTLNIQLLTETDVNEFRLLKATLGLEIHGFVTGDRSFGPVTCYPAIVNGEQKAAVLLIERTHHHPNVVEIIAPISLRQKLDVIDGDIITVKFDLSDLRRPSQ